MARCAGLIAAVGTDICEVPRMALALERTGRRFVERVFTEREREAARAADEPARHFARAFAVKEATFKALGRGWPHAIGWTEVELAPASTGPRIVLLSDRAAAWAERAGYARLLGAVTDDGTMAIAIVVAESA
jgi:holo-[acyl-carrier protein] synthase